MASASPEIFDEFIRDPIEIKCSVHELISLKAYPAPNLSDEDYENWKKEVSSQCFCTICGC